MTAGPVRRVAFFDPYPHLYGGGQRTTLLLAEELGRRGLEVGVVTTAEGPFTEKLEAAGVPVRVVPMPGPLGTYGHRTTGSGAALAGAALPAAWGRLARVLRRGRPDVVHAIDLRGALLAAPAARLAGARPVWQAHLTEPQPVLNRLAAATAGTVVLPSRAACAGLAGVPIERIEVIANAVAPSVTTLAPAHIRDAWTAAGGDPGPGGPTLVTSARLTPQKGIDVLLGAIGRLATTRPALRAVVFGAGQEGYEDYAGDLRRRALEVAPGRVVFAGAVEEPARLYGGGPIYVQPSRYEILPLAILEAMAVGLPVIASDVGGTSEMVHDGVTGVLVPPGDEAALASAVERMLSDPAAAAAMGRAAARLVRARYQVADMADRWQAVYRRLR